MPETPNGLPLLADPEQDLVQLESQLYLYEKGRKLRKFVLDPDWEIVLQVLQDYRDKTRDELIAMAPGDPNVSQAHAAASATNDVFVRFQEDINRTVDCAINPSDELKAYMHGVRQSLDVKAVMEAQG